MDETALDDASRSAALTRGRPHVLGIHPVHSGQAARILGSLSGGGPIGDPSPFTPMKTTSSDTKLDVREWLMPLRRIETLAQLLRGQAKNPSDERETYEMEFADLEAGLPPAIAEPLRGRSRSARRMIAVARNHQCESCHTRVPRGDQGDLLLGRPVFCQFCGVLLYEEVATSEPDATTSFVGTA